MATVSLGVTTADNGNSSGYTTGSFTPATFDLLVAIVTVEGSVSPNTPGGTMSDTQSLGWSQLTRIGYNSAASPTDTIVAFVANKLASNSSMTVTYTCTGDNGTGCTITVFRIAGAESTYVRQFGAAAGAASSTPTVTLPEVALTGNPLVGVVGNATNPATISPRSSPLWTELSDTGHTLPTSGHEAAYIDSGETASSIAWGGTSATAWGAIVVELYNSGTCATPDDSASGYYGNMVAI